MLTDSATKESRINLSDHSALLLMLFSAIGTIALLWWVLSYCYYGFDFADESFYLIWMSNPYNYSASATQFGFFFHPLYLLFDGNIAAIRQTNILFTFCLAWILCSVFLKKIFANIAPNTVDRFIIAASLATASLFFLSWWLPTPNYNGLSLQALLVTAIGIVLADKRINISSILGWCLIGSGGWLAFMAKPTTALILGVGIVCYLLAAQKMILRLLSIAVIVAAVLLIISAYAMDGSIITFVHRLIEGLNGARLLGTTNAQLFRLDHFELGVKTSYIIKLCTFTLFIAAYSSQFQNSIMKWIFFTISIACTTLVVIIASGLIHKSLNSEFHRGLSLWCIPITASLITLTVFKPKAFFKISRGQWALAFLFMIFPYFYAFGTGNNYWYQGVQAGIFWVLAGMILLTPAISRPKLTKILLSLGLGTQLLCAIQLLNSFEYPYGAPQPLRLNDHNFEIGKPTAILKMPRDYSRYLGEVVDTANKAGFKLGTPIIDLSGQSPVVSYVLKANSIGQAWTIGALPGSETLAIKRLSSVPCQQVAAAWLLYEPTSPKKISPEVIDSFGANIKTDYQNVGSFKTAIGAVGYWDSREQQLLKPIRPMDTAIEACEKSRIH